MSFSLNLPPSVLSKEGREAEDTNDATGEEKTKRREDYKKLKELEEARKAGTVPAMQDEEGKDINPHIPQYIMQAPWYFGSRTATLKHQRQQDEKIKTYDGMDKWYKRGVKEGPVSTKFRKGACENCGSMTHKKKDCLERPRKLGAKFTGSDIAPDEHLQVNLDLDYEGKRDRWNGYDINQHKKIFEEFQKMEEAKKLLKAQKLEEEGVECSDGEQGEGDDEDIDDEDKYAEDMEMPGQKFETKQRITVRNLRIREDTAKYLYNLDVNSAHYDPKTRSMRENPFPGKHPTEIPFAGDNFARSTGDAQNIAKAQMFAWEAYEQGADVNLQADPTKLAALSKEHVKRKTDFKSKAQDSVLEKYGGEEHLEAPPRQLLLAQTEDYVEYSRHGTVIKGQEKAKIKSRYEEDIHHNNHTAVWGSFWKEGHWGYKCCHSTIKESYCTGKAGIDAAESNQMVDSLATATGTVPAITASERSADKESVDEEKQAILEMIAAQRKKVEKRKRKKKDKKKHKKKKKKRKKESSSSSSDSSSDSEDEDVKKEKKIKEAIAKERARVKEVDRLMAMDERKRPYNSMSHVAEPTEEELEAFRRTQKNFDDPMAHFL